MRIAIVGLALVAGAMVAALIAGNMRWRRDTDRAVNLLAATHPAARHDATLDNLPAPALRYLRRALPHPTQRVRSAIATQEAEFFINAGWRPLAATQHFTTDPPGFIWDARIQMAPLIAASVRDGYVGGHGSMRASVFGLYSLVDQAATPELDAGALQRFLGEAVWFPTALLPSSAVTWTPHDDRSAAVRMTDNGTAVSLLFEFDGNDDVVRISGDRYKETNGSYVMQRWVIQCSHHDDRSGMRIPTVCEVAWIGPNGPEAYWRGRITAIDYTFWQ